MISYIKHNFYLVIENWAAQIRAHRAHKKVLRQIRRHGKELKMRIKEADALHKATGKAYYVLPDYNGVLQVLDKANIKILKRAKIMNREVTCVDLLCESEYNTLNNHFVVLMDYPAHNGTLQRYEFFRGTILECIDKYNGPLANVQILGNFERAVTIKNGKVTKY